MRNIVVLLSVLLNVLAVQAGQLDFSISSDFSECNVQAFNQSAVVTEYADFKYNNETNELQIEVKFSSAGGVLANGFHFGLNSEASLTTNFYKLAYFYVDGSFSGTVPRINAFTFNRLPQAASSCNNQPGSWQTNAIANKLTEAILPGTSGYGGNPSWVKFAEVIRTATGNTFSIVIDTKAIQNFIPNAAAQYLQSVGMLCFIDGKFSYQCPEHNLTSRLFDFAANHNEHKLTMDFLPVRITNSNYNANGQLTNLVTNACSLCRLREQKANTPPTCSSVSTNSDVIRAGETLEIEFEFLDVDVQDSHSINLYGVPNGAKTSILTAQKKASLSWTPTDANANKTYQVSADMVQDYGHHQSASSRDECSTSFQVLESLKPVCSVKNLTDPLDVTVSKTEKLRNVLRKAHRDLTSLERKLRIKKKTDFSAEIENFATNAVGYLNSVPRQFNTCSERFAECSQTDYFDEYNRYTLELQKLYCDGKKVKNCNFIDNVGFKLFKIWKKRYIKYLIKFKKMSKKDAKKRARTTLRGKFQRKALNLSFRNYNVVLDLIASGDTIHFTCN